MDLYPPMLPDTFYHVYNRGNARENLFLRHDNYQFFLAKSEKYISQIGTLYNYALLPNHFHFLLRTHPLNNFSLHRGEDFSTRVSKTFSNLFNSYTKSFNVFYLRRGTLYTQHFKRKHIDSHAYRLNSVLYIHRNGVHHRYCHSMEEWPYTSHHRIMDDPQEKNNAEVLSWFGGLNGYLEMCKKQTFRNDPNFYLE